MDVGSLFSLVVVLAIIWCAAFFQLSSLIWTVSIGVALLILPFIVHISPVLLVIYWLLFLPAAAFANLHQVRRKYLLVPALPHLKSQLPVISNTEREAIEAGNVWWEKELFCGRPQWTQLFKFPTPTLTAEEQHFLDNQVETVCSMINDWEIVYTDRDLPKEVWDYLKNEKFFGMVIPKQYGGLGFSALAHSTVIVKIASRSVSAAINTMVPNSLGPAELILHYGTDEQKNQYLPNLASGMDIPCFALTAPDAGSDAGAIPDTGIVCRGTHDGKEVIGIRLNWNKRYITLAPIATVLGLAFHMYDPDKLLGEVEDIGITLCLIPTSHPGVEVGNRHLPMHLAFMNGPTRGKDVFIPLDWIVGGPAMAGQGWRMLMECLSIGRSISLPALSTACGKLAYRNTGAYARLRRQFNTSISSFEGIEEALGNIAGYAYTLEACRIMTAGAVDLKVKPSTVSAIAKYHMTELSRKVIAHAMDIHAGHMIQVGPRNFLAHVHFAIPMSITVEGANILTRNLIIFGQGAIRCHPYLLKEVELISAANPDIQQLDKVLMSHIGFFASNLLRNLAYGLSGGLFIFTTIKNKRIKKYERQLTRMSAALALLADTSLILLGGSLKRRERISARLGDIMSQLYLASTVMKYYYDNGKPNSDVDYVCWSLQDCLQKIQVACMDLMNNFPNRFLGKLLSLIIFPFGPPYTPPADKLYKSILTSMLAPSELRDRLTKHCYQSNQPHELDFQLNQALTQIQSIDPILKKLNKAIQTGKIKHKYTFAEQIDSAQQDEILTSEEARKLHDFEALKQDIIKVNEFSFNLDKVIA